MTQPPNPGLDAHAKAEAVYALLLKQYGHPDWRPGFAPMDELILTILSANTSDINSGRAFERLKAAYADWQAVLDAPLDELTDVIRPAGLGPTKAPRIQAALRRVLDERGAFDISFLADLPVDEGLAWLTRFDGVGAWAWPGRRMTRPKSRRCGRSWRRPSGSTPCI